MNWQEFEDRLKAEAQAHQTPVDTDALWDSIQEKNRRRLPIFWWLTGLGALLLGGWLVAIYSSVNNTFIPKETVSLSQSDTTNNFENLSANKTTPSNSNYSSNTSNLQESTSKFQDQPGQSKTKLEALSTNRFANNLKKNNKFSSNKSTKKITGNKQLSKGDTIFSTSTHNLKESTAVTTPRDILIKDTTNFSQISTVEPVADMASTTNKSFISEASTINVIAPFLPIPPSNFLPLISPLPNNPLSSIFLPIAEIKANKNPNRIYVGLQTGYFAWKIQQDADSSTRIGEKPLASMQFGLQMQLPIGQKWSLRTGVQYAQFSSVFRWARKWEETRDIPVLNYYVNGNIDSTYTSALFRYARNVQHYNRLQSISIPVEIQYRIAWKNWNLRPSIGTQIQVWQKAKGVILEGNDTNAQNYANIYQRAFNLGLRFGFALEIPLDQRMRLTLEPAGILDITRQTKSIYSAEYFQQWGISLGVLRQW